MSHIDRVILSTNEHGNHIEFWPLVATAWQRLLKVRVSLAFVTGRSEDDPLVREMRRYGEVVLIRELAGIPSQNLTKASRYLLASRYPDDVCLIDDIDLLPLQSEYFIDLLQQRRKGELLVVGAEVYLNTPHEGKFPIGNLTAEGGTFRELINPGNLDDIPLVNSWKGMRVFDQKEAIDADPALYSDESMLRALVNAWSSRDRVRHVPRGFYPYTSRAIDRSEWHVDVDKLRAGHYVEAHLLRPLHMYREQIRPLMMYLMRETDGDESFWQELAVSVLESAKGTVANPAEVAYAHLSDCSRYGSAAPLVSQGMIPATSSDRAEPTVAVKTEGRMPIAMVTETMNYVSGGVRCIAEVLNRLKERGYDTACYVTVPDLRCQWLPTSFPILPATALADYDGILISPFSPTAEIVARSKAKGKFYWVHSYEPKFPEITGRPDSWRVMSENSYRLPELQYFATSTYVKMILELIYKRKVLSPLVPGGVDTELFHPGEKNHAPIRVMFLSRENPFRGASDIVEALVIAEKLGVRFEVFVMGQKIDMGGIGHEYFPPLPQAEFAKLLGSADIFIHGSHFEGLPLPPLEAMAARCAVISTYVGASDYLLHGYNALVVPPGRPDKIAEALIELATDGELRKSLAEGGYTTVTGSYTWEHTVDHLLEALSEGMGQTVEIHRQQADTLCPDVDNYGQVAALIKSGCFNEALAMLRGIVQRHPGFAPAHHDIATIYEETGELGRAREHHETAARLAPDNTELALALADHYFRSTDNMQEAAVKIYLTLHGQRPDNVDLLVRLGDSCIALGHPDAAAFYRKALELEPANPVAIKGMLQVEAGRAEVTRATGLSTQGPPPGAAGEYLVTAIVSTYNSARFLRGCLEDLQAQTIADRLEIIVIDSGSEEDEAAIVTEFQQKYSNIVYIRTEERETVYGAWNRGIRAARGKYITNANTDDRHARDALAVMANILEKNPGIALVYADLYITETENETFEQHTRTGEFRWHDWNRDALLDCGCFMGPQPMWRKSVHRLYGYFDETMITSGDYEFWLRISQNMNFYHLKLPLGLYLKSPQSIEHRNAQAQAVENKRILAQYRDARARGLVINLPAEGENGLPTNLVSIIIPTGGGVKGVKRCIDSLAGHTAEKHEVVVVLRGESREKFRSLEAQWNSARNVRLLESASPAYADACNIGMESAAGRFIVILDSNSTLSDGWLSALLEHFDKGVRIGVVAPRADHSCDNPTPPAGYLERNRHRTILGRVTYDGCCLFSRELFYAIGGLDTRFNTPDTAFDDFCLRAEIAGYANIAAGDIFLHRRPEKRSAASVTLDKSDKAGFAGKWAVAGLEESVARKVHAGNAVAKAVELWQQGIMDKAMEALLRLGIPHCPEERGLYYTAARMLLDGKNHRDAILVLEGMPGFRSDPLALALIGYGKQGLGLDDQAHDYGERALALAPRSAAALNLKGVLALKSSDVNEAGRYFRLAIEADKGGAEPYTNLGLLKWSEGEQTEGLELIEKGFILSPAKTDSTYLYHEAISREGAFDRAETVLREAISAYPRIKRFAYLLVEALMQQGKHQEALAEIRKVVASHGLDETLLQAALEMRKVIGPLQPARKKQSVSVCMIVKDEEQHLPKALCSLVPIADELIVVDTGSCDRTRDIATAFGAKVYDFAWTGSFAEARNESLARASCQWILVMDADEVISPLDHHAFRETIARSRGNVAYELTSRNYSRMTNQAQWQNCDDLYVEEGMGYGWTPSTKVRLFPNNKGIRFQNPVHELVEPSLRKLGITYGKCGIAVHHYGSLDTEKFARKAEEYYQLGKKKLTEKGDDLDAISELAIQAGGLGRYEEAIDLWQRVISINPNLPLAFFNLSYDYLQLGRFEETIAASLQAKNLGSDFDKEATVNWSIAELCIGDKTKVIDELKGLLSQYPDYPPALNVLMTALFCDNDVAGGRELLRKVAGMEIEGFIRDISNKLLSAGKHGYVASLLGNLGENYQVGPEFNSLLNRAYL